MIVPLRHGRSAHRSRPRRKDAAADADLPGLPSIVTATAGMKPAPLHQKFR